MNRTRIALVVCLTISVIGNGVLFQQWSATESKLKFERQQMTETGKERARFNRAVLDEMLTMSGRFHSWNVSEIVAVRDSENGAASKRAFSHQARAHRYQEIIDAGHGELLALVAAGNDGPCCVEQTQKLRELSGRQLGRAMELKAATP